MLGKGKGEGDPLARREGETLNAWAALNDYARMGPGRSLDKLHAAYRIQIESGSSAPPVKNRATLGQWSADHDWQIRVEAFDAAEFNRQQEKYEEWNDAELERIQRALETGHSVLGGIFESVDMRRVPPRDAAAFLRAIAEVSRQVRGDDAQRVELTGRDGGAVEVKDESGLSERAAMALELFVQAREAANRDKADAGDDDSD